MKKFLYHALFLSTILFFFFNQTPQSAAANTDMSLSNGASVKYLTDNSYYTCIELPGGTRIRLSNSSDVKSLYIEWDLGTNKNDDFVVNDYWFNGSPKVKEWTLVIDGTEYSYGKKGFLHEFIELPKSGELLEIIIPDGGASICSVYPIESDEIPDFVQQWEEPHEAADLLVLSSHADDEILFFGGTLPYYASELGLRVQVVYFTYHEQKCRSHELLNGLYYCGIRNYPIISDFTDIYSTALDHAKTLYPYEEALEFVVSLYRRFQPSVLVTHDLNGEYGHGVHMLTANLAVSALEISSDPSCFTESYEKYGSWNVPKAYLHLYDKNPIDMEWEMNLDSYDGLPAWEVIRTALNQYESQLQYYGNSLTRNPESPYDCTRFGLYRSLVGTDTGMNDFFENIPENQYKKQIELARLAPAFTPTNAPITPKEESPTPTVSPIVTLPPKVEDPVFTPTKSPVTPSEEFPAKDPTAVPVNSQEDKNDRSSYIAYLGILALILILSVCIWLIRLYYKKSKR